MLTLDYRTYSFKPLEHLDVDQDDSLANELNQLPGVYRVTKGQYWVTDGIEIKESEHQETLRRAGNVLFKWKNIAARFSITYSEVTDETAAQGDVWGEGFIDRGITLREAIRQVLDSVDENGGLDCIEANCGPDTSDARWITFYCKRYTHDAWMQYTIHFPEQLKPVTRRRLVSFLQSYDLWSLS